MTNISFLSLILGVLALLWSIKGIFRPNALFFAVPEMRTRKHAVGFPLRVGVVCFLFTGATAGAGWYLWILAGITAFMTLGYLINLRG